ATPRGELLGAAPARGPGASRGGAARGPRGGLRAGDLELVGGGARGARRADRAGLAPGRGVEGVHGRPVPAPGDVVRGAAGGGRGGGAEAAAAGRRAPDGSGGNPTPGRGPAPGPGDRVRGG